ncbi:hypothetical protein [Paraburkholderia sp. J63]|uniref:hypothetical protein n=1 Tax=Paraburkholderia sp. J63 TaxID=2805434 RepID=UPI002ABE8139|nr:hypothetical protein [Paraburkholderia sp. J63]
MNKTILGMIVGVAALAASTAASAHVDVALGVDVPGVACAPAQPVYVAPPAPVTVAWRGDDDWRAREWREREWREHERREHQRREWHDHDRWDH